MDGRSFELFKLNLHEDTALFRALKKTADGFHIEFSIEQTRLLQTARKKNTLLFEQLTDICGYSKACSPDVNRDLMMECVIVNMAVPKQGDTLIYSDGGRAEVFPAGQLPSLAYLKGIRIGGVDFRPFVASASMARMKEYLFVRRDRVAALMERLSLGLVGCSEKGQLVMTGLTGNTDVGVSKISAYLGLSLSDGLCVREMTELYEKKYGVGSAPAIELNKDSVVCADGAKFTIPFGEMGPYVWKTAELARGDVMAAFEPEERACDESDRLLVRFFRALFAGREQAAALLRAEGEAVAAAFCRRLREFTEKGADAKALERGALLPGLPDDDETLARRMTGYCAAYGMALLRERMKQGGYFEEDTFSAVGGEWDAAGLSFVRTAGRSVLEKPVIELADGAADNKALATLVHLADGAGKTAVMCTRKEERGGAITLRFGLQREKNGGAKRYGAQLTVPDEQDCCAELYDGMGFADEETFDRLEQLLLCKSREELTAPRRFDALIIRLPFIKGLIVRMNFLDYFMERARSEAGEAFCEAEWKKNACLTDLYGHKRPLFDAEGRPKVHMLLTESMCKANKYFKRLSPKAKDEWAEYWARAEQYGADLLIAQRNSTPSAHSRLNYQFLCTIGLTGDELNALADATVRDIEETLKTPAKALEQTGAADNDCGDDLNADTADLMELADGEASDEAGNASGQGTAVPEETGSDADGAEEDAPDTQFEQVNEQEVLRALAGRNPEFLQSGYLRDYAAGRANSDLLDVMLGRVKVAGDVRLLVPDLKATLDVIADRYIAGRKNAPITSPINRGDQGHGCFYAAGANAPWVKEQVTGVNPATGEATVQRIYSGVVALRNPHFAVGEDALLAPLPHEDRKEYDRWFGHLSGVAMLPVSAFLTINGADSDGDRGNICCEPTVLNAVRRTAAGNVRLLQGMLKNRSAIIEWLEGERQNSEKARRGYIDALIRWIRFSLPALPEGETACAPYRRDYCPALFFSGTGESARKDTVRELALPDTSVSDRLAEQAFQPDAVEMSGLDKRLWEVFELTGEQRIGIMSLNALDMASMAYCEGMLDGLDENACWDETDMKRWTAAWLAHWRVVNCGLDTANEIDMAKTGLRTLAHELASCRDVDMQCGLLFDDRLPMRSKLREFRDAVKLKKKDGSLGLWKFEGTLRSVARELGIAPAPDRAGADAAEKAEVTPLMRTYGQSARPLAVDSMPAVRYADWVKNGTHRSGEDKRPGFKAYFRPADEYVQDPGAEKELFAAYDDYMSQLSARSAMRRRRANLRDRYQKTLRCLLRRYPLTGACEAMEQLLGDGVYETSFLGRLWPAESRDGRKAQVKALHEQLGKDRNLAMLIWADEEVRRSRLAAAPYRLCGGDSPEHNGVVSRFADNEQGVYLLKAALMYLLEAVDMEQEGVETDGVPLTPQGLRSRMLEIAGQYGLTGEAAENAVYRVLAKRGASPFMHIHMLGAGLSRYLKEGQQ